MEVKGKIKLIKNTQVISEKFSKREFVVITEGEHAQHISMEFILDKCDLLDTYSVGDLVNVSINLKGREWTDPKGEVKHFNTIQAWKIDKNEAVVGDNKDASGSDDSDELPF